MKPEDYSKVLRGLLINSRIIFDMHCNCKQERVCHKIRWRNKFILVLTWRKQKSNKIHFGFSLEYPL